MVKKIDRAKLEWLNEELRDLSGQGVIEESVAQRIRGHYEVADEEPVHPQAATAPVVHAGRAQRALPAVWTGKQHYFLAVLVSLGVLMIGSGVVLLFAHNWDMFSTLQRIVTAFIPIVLAACCGVYTIVREKDSRWQEASAFFTATGFAVLTALVSQIYHISGTLHDFSMLIMAVSLPLVYLFRSQLLAVVYCVFLFVFRDSGFYYGDYAGLLYLIGIAPFILYYLFFHKPAGTRTIWMRYVCLLPLLWLLLHFGGLGNSNGSYFAAAGLLYVAGLHCGEMRQGGWRNPWLPLGWFVFTIFLLFNDILFHSSFSGYESLTLWLVFFAAGVFAASRRITPLKAAIVIVSLLPVAVSVLDLQSGVTVLAASACLLLLGALSLWEGTRERGIMKVNAGMLQIALLAAAKFADGRISILLRALIFMMIGAAFIVANVYMSRKFRSESALSAPESEVQNDV